jgi:hypothetical protein
MEMAIRTIFKGIVFGAISLVLAGCMGHARPDWVQKNRGAFLNKQVFYGVGKISAAQSDALLKMTAEKMAQSELVRILDAFIVSLIKDYAQTLSEADLKEFNETQNAERVLKTYATTSILFNIAHIKSWTDPKDGTFYSLARLTLKEYTKEIADVRELSPALKGFIRKNAAESFDRFKMQNEEMASQLQSGSPKEE